MIPAQNIVAWGHVAPWTEPRQIEQDLIISRAVVELFNDEFLKEQLRFRGGTALHKLHFQKPLRYSEDLDLVRTAHGAIGPILDRVREVLLWLGQARYDPSPVAPKLRFRADAEDGGPPLRLKVEIGTRETAAYDGPLEIQYEIDNPWFSGRASIPTFSPEEMLATKFRALLQRNKGRDLFDVAHGLFVLDQLNSVRVVKLFKRYLERQEQTVSRAQAEERMFAILGNPGLLADIRPLLEPGEARRLTEEWVHGAFTEVFTKLIRRLPGEPWARTDEMSERFGLVLGMNG